MASHEEIRPDFMSFSRFGCRVLTDMAEQGPSRKRRLFEPMTAIACNECRQKRAMVVCPTCTLLSEIEALFRPVQQHSR